MTANHTELRLETDHLRMLQSSAPQPATGGSSSGMMALNDYGYSKSRCYSYR